MSHRKPTSLLLAALLGLTFAVVGCQKSSSESAKAAAAPYEGKYKNSHGQVVLEIKEGRAIFTNPQTKEKSDTTFAANGNNLAVESSAGTFTLTFQPPDKISGLPEAIAKDTAPLQKE